VKGSGRSLVRREVPLPALLRPSACDRVRWRNLSITVLPARQFVWHNNSVQLHASSARHGVDPADARHAFARPVAVVDLDPESTPPKILVIGPDRSGNLLELIALVLADDDLLVIHAMRLRPVFFRYLPDPTE
jgi:hypothetical protein